MELEERVQKDMNQLCGLMGITKEGFMSDDRKRSLVNARKVYAYILHKKYGLGCSYVGKVMKKNHGTILYYFRDMEQIIGTSHITPLQQSTIDLMLSKIDHKESSVSEIVNRVMTFSRKMRKQHQTNKKTIQELKDDCYELEALHLQKENDTIMNVVYSLENDLGINSSYDV
jgi:chromosomal replication initiation ATPase DnaA